MVAAHTMRQARMRQEAGMKILSASDIHGSAYWAERLMEAIETEQPDRIVLLGD